MVRSEAVCRAPARNGWLWRGGVIKEIVRVAKIYGAPNMC